MNSLGDSIDGMRRAVVCETCELPVRYCRVLPNVKRAMRPV